MNTITMHGNPLHLEGTVPALGSKAPHFTLCANDLSPRSLKDFSGKVVVVVTVPSLDTGVCDMEVRRFNQELAALSPDISIIAVSCDLPFAQARWCGAAHVSAVQTLSDYKEAAFGKDYGILIQELRLLGRAVFVIDRKGTVTYVEIVSELGNEPQYDKALEAAKKAV
ncbi:MAG: thiol peroxidase [Desulfovibrionaceae bacterium]